MNYSYDQKQDKKEYFNPRHEVVVDNTIGTRGFGKIAELKCTYDDLKHFFGEPMRLLNSDRRVEWGFKELETDIGATIYDDNSGKWVEKDIPLEQVFDWCIGGHCDRSLEMIGQIFEQEFRKGKKFLSKPLEDEDN